MAKAQQNPDDWSKDNQVPHVDHPVIAESDPLKESGEEVGLLHPPIVSIHPTSDTKTDKPKEYSLFDNANRYLNHDGIKHDFEYPLEIMAVGQGFFVPVEPDSNTDKTMKHLYEVLDIFHKQTAQVEKDKNGDDVLEAVTTLPKKRNLDGTIQLDGTGTPITSANHANRPKLIHIAEFVIKAAVKDDDIAEGRKAESDGVLVIRVA